MVSGNRRQSVNATDIAILQQMTAVSEVQALKEKLIFLSFFLLFRLTFF